MDRSRAVVTDSGLARKLGKRVTFRRGVLKTAGTVGYFPDRFILVQKGRNIRIKEGDRIGLPVGSVRGSKTHYREHVYTGASYQEI
jgi:hypothetical protein|tara:strand:- start:8431 stop:8688 length:258 start_codon:yes stop_codon:yes gene_type:complete